MFEKKSIIELNRDVEPFVIQSSATRTPFFNQKFDDKYSVLQFLHFSDVHMRLDCWDRVMEYMNYYKDYISFALHTGDYCEGSQERYRDLYADGIERERIVYNSVGNHDTFSYDSEHVLSITGKKKPHELLFNHTDDWDVTFFDLEYSMSYYKDFPESNIRMIVLDPYYDIEEQTRQLAALLEDAREKGIYVITAMHEKTDAVEESFGVTFNTLNDYQALSEGSARRPFEETIVEFVNSGGVHICHFAGHDHHDGFGITEHGILNSIVPCATTWNGWSDGKRVEGTKTQDCFNIVSIDPNLKLLKLVRVGDNSDHYLREKKLLCFDFANRKVIYNG